MNSTSKSTLRRTLITLVVIVLAGLAMGVISMKLANTSKTPAYLSGYGGDFTLESVKGPVSLSDFEGRVVVIYFGYTTCPDICPTTLASLVSATRRLPEQARDNVQILLVTFDPERDSAEVLDSYVKQFDPDIIGLTGDKDAIAEVANQYGAIYERVELPDSAVGYAYDHSSVSAVIDAEGNLRSLIRHQDSIDEMAAKLLEVL